MTYHFDGMDDLLREAFTRFVATGVARIESALRAATGREEARAAVVDLVHGDAAGPGASRDLVLTLERYTLAARRPAFRDITRAWMVASRAELGRHFVPEDGRVDALIEGLSIHRALDTDPSDRHFTQDTVAQMTRAPGT
jgi:DNA-binding transcriptional regulator YbjK